MGDYADGLGNLSGTGKDLPMAQPSDVIIVINVHNQQLKRRRFESPSASGIVFTIKSKSRL